MIGSDSSTRSGLTQFKGGFEFLDVSQLLSDDILSWKLLLLITNDCPKMSVFCKKEGPLSPSHTTH